MSRVQFAAKAAEYLERLSGRLPLTVESGRNAMTLEAASFELLGREKVPALKLSVRFIRNGIDITPQNYNPHYVVNPPLLVPDPAGNIVITKQETNADGETVSVDYRYRRDPVAVLREHMEDQFRKIVKRAR